MTQPAHGQNILTARQQLIYISSMTIKPELPTPQLVDRFYSQFDQDERYALGDRAILKLVQAMPHNDVIEDVLLKVCAINQLYSTQIYATVVMARHICTLKIDPLLAKHDTGIVDKIAKAPIGKDGRNCYSFATKYCSWHDQMNYPIYDRFVEISLIAYRDHFKFHNFQPGELRKYGTFKAIVELFRTHFGLSQYSLKQLDKFLWLYGKELEAQKQRAQ